VRAIEHHRQLADSGKLDPGARRIFGISQGHLDRKLRLESLEHIQSLPFDGVAVGGLSVGESREEMYEILDLLGGHLDPNRPRYLMGVGTIPDFLEAVKNGIDMFDCVLPTRNARNGQALTSAGKVNVRNAKFAHSNEPLDANCDCKTCRRYSIGYIRHMFKAGEMFGPQLVTYHNLYFFHRFMSQMRSSIKEGSFQQFYDKWKKVDF
jgi:queuine tRNA-ribosyltransferase